MTPEQQIKREILLDAADQGDVTISEEITADNVNDLYAEHLVGKQLHWDYQSEFREGQVETGLPSQFSRHYEAKEVARKMRDGTWIGWPYWYGGGKHGEPEAMPWMQHAYELSVTEEEKLVVVRTFAKVNP